MKIQRQELAKDNTNNKSHGMPNIVASNVEDNSLDFHGWPSFDDKDSEDKADSEVNFDTLFLDRQRKAEEQITRTKEDEQYAQATLN